MDVAFALRVAIAFVIGGLAVAAFTEVAERRGSRLGGLLLSFPVKVVVSLLLIALNEGDAFAAEAAAATPAGIGVNLVLLIATALLARRLPAWPALMGGVAIWLAAATALVLFEPGSPFVGFALWGAFVTVGLVLLDRVPGVHGDRRSKRDPGKFGIPGLLTRAAAAGTVVAGAVVLARVSGPLVGGLASVFPSGWLTTRYLLVRRHGPEFTAATTRVMVAGSVAPALFGVVAALAIAPLGIWLGLVAGLAAAATASGAAAALLAWRDRSRGASARSDISHPRRMARR